MNCICSTFAVLSHRGLPSKPKFLRNQKFASLFVLITNYSRVWYKFHAAMKLKDACSLEKKNYDKSKQHVKKQRHYFADKSPSMVFPVVMYGCECWTIKKAELWRTDAFELWCWRRLLRVPWAARKSNQSILKGNKSWRFTGRTDAKAEVPTLGHLTWTADFF